MPQRVPSVPIVDPSPGPRGPLAELEAVGEGQGFEMRPVDLFARNVQIRGEASETLVVEALEGPGQFQERRVDAVTGQQGVGNGAGRCISSRAACRLAPRRR
jgi:hypothetical protein